MQGRTLNGDRTVARERSKRHRHDAPQAEQTGSEDRTDEVAPRLHDLERLAERVGEDLSG